MMTAPKTRFALIGRSFPSETFEGLQQAFVTARAERRGCRGDRVTRAWRGTGEPIVLPKRLSA